MKQEMKSKKKKYVPYVVLWILFWIIVFWEEAFITDIHISDIIIIVMSIVLLVKNKMPSKKYIIVSIVFMLLSAMAYLGVQLQPLILIWAGLKVGVPTLLSSLAVLSVMEKQGGYQIVSKKYKYSLLVSVLIGVVSGGLLSVINTFLAIMQGAKIAFDFSLSKLLVCLSPGIYEEMAYRAIFMAYCIYYIGSKKMNGFMRFTMYFMMIMPHSYVHGYGWFTTIMLGLLFGLPFSILQRKRDITSAMISHGFVDAVRFTLFGI